MKVKKLIEWLSEKVAQIFENPYHDFKSEIVLHQLVNYILNELITNKEKERYGSRLEIMKEDLKATKKKREELEAERQIEVDVMKALLNVKKDEGELTNKDISKVREKIAD